MMKRAGMIAAGIAVLLALPLGAAGEAVPADPRQAAAASAETAQPASIPAYDAELSRWKISNTGTNAAQTTAGINNALKWAAANGYRTFRLPSGTYLIDKNSRINMVANMRFELPDDAVLQKETNGKESYQTLYVGYGADNVTLSGGTYRGDKDTHDYSKKETPHTSGTHEGGYGIVVHGAANITIEGVKAVNFTGDGLVVGGHGTMAKDLYAAHFVSGGLDDKGKPAADAAKIRTKTALDFSHPIFKKERQFELSNAVNLPFTFDLYFYKANGAFLTRMTNKRVRDIITIPEGAHRFHIVFAKQGSKGAYIEFWNRVVTRGAVVKDSEFAFNRRQGITFGGVDGALVTGSLFHDMKGTAPQSGIDVEAGFGENGHRNSNITIRGNEFYNNAAYDIILYDGRDAVVEDNHLASKGVIGLAVSDPFSGARIINNHFDGTRISADNDATFIGNRMNDSYTYFKGPNISIDGMVLTDATFSVSSAVPFGVSVSNVTINNNKKSDSGFTIWGQPIKVKNMTINGQPTLRSMTGGVAPGSIFDNLKIVGFNPDYGLALPPGVYNNCVLESADGSRFGAISLALAGKYEFNGCTFKSGSTSLNLLYADNPKLELAVNRSTFEVRGNGSAVSIQSAKNVVLDGNTIVAKALTSANTEVIKLNDSSKRKEKHDILKALIRNNSITTNIAAIGISTANAGTGAPPYTIAGNKLVKAKLALKANDELGGNTRTE